MFYRRFEELNRTAAFHILLLAFIAGAVNAGGYLACARFVSHVTGFATLFGVDLARGRPDAAIGILSVPAFFLLGAMISAWFVDRRKFRSEKPQHAAVMALVGICLLLAGAGGYFHYFGEFGESLRLKRDYFLLALLCMASGLQNATITSSSGFTIRTTHLTGITTDLGIGLVRLFSRALPKELRSHERRSNWMRILTIAAFAAGSAVSALLCLQYGYIGFLLPAVLAFYISIITIYPTALTVGTSRVRILARNVASEKSDRVRAEAPDTPHTRRFS